MKLRLHLTYDYEVSGHNSGCCSAEQIASTDLENLTAEKISVDDFIEVLGGRVNFAIEVLES